MKSNIKFKQWESRVFGYGYGSGEEPVLKAIKVFFESLEPSDGIGNPMYDYELLEGLLGETVTWLLINAFAHNNVIEYGTSARHGWISNCALFVRDYIKDKSVDELYDILMSDEDFCECEGAWHEECGENEMIKEDYACELLKEEK